MSRVFAVLVCLILSAAILSRHCVLGKLLGLLLIVLSMPLTTDREWIVQKAKGAS